MLGEGKGERGRKGIGKERWNKLLHLKYFTLKLQWMITDPLFVIWKGHASLTSSQLDGDIDKFDLNSAYCLSLLGNHTGIKG